MTSDNALGDADVTWGVGATAERLGIAASTLRTWERRYEVGPTHRTVGGHRRYTEQDIERVELMRRLLNRGLPPRDAAKVAHGLDDSGLAAALAGDGHDAADDELTASELVDALISATVLLDGDRIAGLFGGALRRMKIVEAWTTVIAPTLTRIGREWADGRFAIESEHLASECLVAELRAYGRSRRPIDSGRATILLASAEDDLHSLPVIALEAALAEVGLGCHVLGARFPASALASISQRLDPDVVFLWASMPRSGDDELWEVMGNLPSSTTVILGGPGWPLDVDKKAGPRGPKRRNDLRSTVQEILHAVGPRSAA